MIINLNPCVKIRDKIKNQLHPNPPLMLSKGNVINVGVDKQLDELRDIKKSVKNFLDKMLEREIEKTSISSLKISYNNVFGYYIEVRNAHKDKVPEEWIRKQTLVNAERYITEELKVYEHKILGAEEKILALEQRLFQELILEMASYINPIQMNAQIIGRIDCLLSFAMVAEKHHYCKPEINEGKALKITKGRHPVIEQSMPLGEPYVSNDLVLDPESQQIMMITGPNMSGKSALLRQTALIVLMAQMGCFVPAEKAEIGVVDKVFTRVGASDNISSGESTFMVEMNETASILNNLSPRSLILLDEIGRGTSTYDGISIAWAIAEYLHETKKAKCKTLFATHYHELNEMTHKFKRIKNFNVAVKEVGKKILFIRKLTPGGSEHSFGIHVAKMAGMPSSVLKRSEQMLKDLESRHSDGSRKNSKEIKEALNKLDLNCISHSSNQKIQKDTDIYLVDSYGESSRFYNLTNVSFVGGSIIKHGGQNPLEPARLGNYIVSGPNINNFKEIYAFLNNLKMSSFSSDILKMENLILKRLKIKTPNKNIKKIIKIGNDVLEKNLFYIDKYLI